MTRKSSRMRAVGIAMVAAAAVISLGACGSRKGLEPKPGMAPVPVAHGASQPATPAELMQPSTQARPDRTVEPLNRSQERPKEDPFDLPPS